MTGMTLSEFKRELANHNEFELIYQNIVYALYKEACPDGTHLIVWPENGDCIYNSVN